MHEGKTEMVPLIMPVCGPAFPCPYPTKYYDVENEVSSWEEDPNWAKTVSSISSKNVSFSCHGAWGFYGLSRKEEEDKLGES